MNLYHTETGLPKGFALPNERVSLTWTRHADAARTDDRYGSIPKFDSLPLCRFKVIEVELDGNRVNKVVVRGHFDAERDVVFVLIPGKSWVVKTVWQNLRTDTHKTLDRSRYTVVGD